MFMDAIAGAVPLAGHERDRVRVPPPEPRPAPAREVVAPPAAELAIERGGERVEARRAGVNRAQVAELRRGRIRPEASIDLHGHTVADAEPALRRFLVEAAQHRRRCVLVIHGRGLHSDGAAWSAAADAPMSRAGGAILRDAVIAALLGPLSGLVHCLTTAAPADGGAGATYVMVRS